MGCCDSCKGDKHDQHRAWYSATIRRKGRDVGTAEHECLCPTCTQKPDWRDRPATVVA
jgi:hypothetical protein